MQALEVKPKTSPAEMTLVKFGLLVKDSFGLGK